MLVVLVAPAARAPTVMVWVLPSGLVTTALTAWAVLGPALVITTDTVMVCPGVLLAGALSVIATSDTELTTKTAEAAFSLVPTLVTKAPAAIVLVTVPATELVTTTVTVQMDAGEINVPAGRVTDPPPGGAVATPPVQPVVVTAEGDALTNPPG